MKCVGVDASTSCTGYSVFEDGALVDYGAIKPKGKDWRERLVAEGPEFKALLKKHRPDIIYMENVPLMKKRQMETLVILGACQGYVLGIASSIGIPIEFLMPTEWRSHIGLYDGTRKGMTRDEMKHKAVELANKEFGLDLKWYSPSSTRNDDDIAEAILIAYSQIKPKSVFGKPKSQR
jgi:Holliday junction resolvasome RuvABC endonuclease subunit